MTFAYFDTSALIKRYIREPGSARVISLLRQHALLSASITPVELVSALSRRRRARELSEEGFAATVSRFQNERIRWELVELGETVLSRVEEIVQGPVPVRALDAVHIASLMAFQAASSVQIPLVTGDGRQRDAANEIGLDVVWVG